MTLLQAMRPQLTGLALGAGLSLLSSCLLLPGSSAAQGIPSPFGEPETSRPEKRPKPSAQAAPLDPVPARDAAGGAPGVGYDRAGPAGTATLQPVIREDLPSPPVDEAARTVMRGDLAPVMAGDGSGLPHELWRGMTAEGVEKLLASLEIPPRSAALHGLFRRLITSDVPAPAGVGGTERFTALRVDALGRAGLIPEAAAILARDPSTASDPVLSVLAARTAIAQGERERGCSAARGFAASLAALPEPLKVQSILISSFCAAAQGNTEAAQIQVALARELGSADSPGLDAIDAIASGARPVIDKGKPVGLIDWRILELAPPVDAARLTENASPGLLAVISKSQSTEPGLRVLAAEHAARLNALSAKELADIYLGAANPGAGNEDASAAALLRAKVFKAAMSEQTPMRKARLIRGFLDETRRDGLYWVALQALAPAAAAIRPVPEIGWFAETAVETALASGDYASARAWAQFGSSLDGPGGAQRTSLTHWLALADISDPAARDGRSAHLAAVEAMAVRKQFSADMLHRLATVLDALDIQVPIPLWELASREPQPSTGHLPATGVLSELADAAKKKEFGHTVLLAMQALGPNGAEGAHMIALGDSIRALRRAGLEDDARKLSLEALFAGWPRTGVN